MNLDNELEFNRRLAAVAEKLQALVVERRAAAPQVVADERVLPPLPAFDIEGGYYDSESGYTKKTMQAYARAALAAAPAQAQEPRKPTDISKRLREWADKRAIAAHYGDLMRAAADEIERYYGGMLNWKATAEAKNPAPVQPVAVPDGLAKLNAAYTCKTNGGQVRKAVWVDEVKALFAAPAAQGDVKELTDEEIEALTHNSGLIGVAGDNPLRESKLIGFARAAIAAKAINN